MNWSRVADHLIREARSLRLRSSTGFTNDTATQQEMRTRASIFYTIGKAIEAGEYSKGPTD